MAMPTDPYPTRAEAWAWCWSHWVWWARIWLVLFVPVGRLAWIVGDRVQDGEHTTTEAIIRRTRTMIDGAWTDDEEIEDAWMAACAEVPDGPRRKHRLDRIRIVILWERGAALEKERENGL